MHDAKQTDKLYRHYAGNDGKFHTEEYAVMSRSRVSYALEPVSKGADSTEIPPAWIGNPRAAELWTTDPDPDRAYEKLLSSAKKDLDTAEGRLGVYKDLYAKLSATKGRHDPADPDAPEHKFGKILIMGRAQSGKTTMARLLSELTGLSVLKTSTSRPKRYPDEDIYHFYTPKAAAAIPANKKLFRTLAVDGFERWTDPDDFLDAGIAVLDPTAMVQAIRLWQAQGFLVTVLYCGDPQEARRSRWMKTMAGDDGSGWDQAIASFGHREKTEGPMFDALERSIKALESEDAADAVLYPNAAAPMRSVAGEDRLEIYKSSHDYGPGDFVKDFLDRLAAVGHYAVPYREFPSAEDTVFDPEDYTDAEWDMLCRIFGLVPGCTARIALGKPLVKASTYPGARKDCDFRKEAGHA